MNVIFLTTLQHLGFATSGDGLVVTQTDGDTGDSPQKTSMAHIALIAQNKVDKQLVDEYMMALIKHWSSSTDKNLLCRDSLGRWNDPKDFSRDQHDPVIIALGFYDDHGIVKSLMRWLKYQNTDICSPSTWAINIRAARWWWCYPLLLIFDLQLVLSSIITAFDRNPDHVDDDNHLCRLVQTILVYATPMSWLARKIYVWTRPKNLGSQFEKSNIMAALRWKHRTESGANQCMVELWRPIVMKWFS